MGPVETSVYVRDLEEAKAFYQTVLNCRAETGVDALHCRRSEFVISCTFDPELGRTGKVACSYYLDSGKYVPLLHRLPLDATRLRDLAKSLRNHGVQHDFFQSSRGPSAELGERVTFSDPSGNAFEAHVTVEETQSSPSEFRLRSIIWCAAGVAVAALLAFVHLRPADSGHYVDAATTAMPAHWWP